MERLKLLYLDSAEIGRVASDLYATKDVGRVQRANKFLDRLRNSTYVLFFNHHLLQELLALKNDDLVEKRISFISTLPIVCWPDTSTSDGLLGAYCDIQALEVNWSIENSEATYENCRSELSLKLLRYGSGEDLLSNYIDFYLAARDLDLFDVERVKAIESLTHAAERSIDTMTVLDIKNAKFKSQHDIEKWFQNYSLTVQKRISTLGDKKLKNAATHATEFVDSVSDSAGNLLEDGVLNLDGFLASFRVRPDQVNDQTTVWEIGQLAIFNSQMKLLIENGNLVAGEVANVNPDRIPSWVIWRELNLHMKADRRATGSSMSDRYHATFVSYVDMMQCDKRVHHYFNISKSNRDPLLRAKTIVFKVRDYADLVLQ